MKVLVTGARAVLGQGIIRSLLDGNLRPEVVAVDPDPLAAGLYWTPRRHLVPLARDPGYACRVEALLELERPDAVLLGTDVELEVFARHRERWERRFGAHIVVSRPDVVRTADDKWLTYRFLREHGFGAPESCLPGDEAELARAVGFPLVVKPRVGARSAGVVVVRDERALVRAVTGGGDVIIQECVASDRDEYTAGALVFDGRCDASIVMRRDLRDGNTHRAYVDTYPDLNAEFRRIAAALDPYGPANVQFRVDAEGRVRVFEINARFSGTTPFRMRAGFNEVEMVLRHVLYGEPVVEPAIQPMTILRYFTEVVVPAEAAMT